ncbi:MAG: hypothetical protein ABJG86_17815 [Nitratireductor sp.]|uniref:hypothetical protein n=1 Tax=Alphaproteobacteria TaxID=28211 RepID=UPI003269E875
MLYRFDEAIRAVVGQIVSQTDDLCQRIGRSVHDEDDFTSRMADRIERSVDGAFVGGMNWRVETRKFPWRGAGAEESLFGADLGLVLRMSGKDFDVSKGYLIQAKMLQALPLETTGKAPFTKNDRVFEQCDKMLGITSESYVWFYSQMGISIIRAGSMVGTDPKRIPEMYRQSLHGFMTRAFMSWNGDYSLGDLSKNSLEMMTEEYRVKQAVLIHATEAREEG